MTKRRKLLLFLFFLALLFLWSLWYTRPVDLPLYPLETDAGKCWEMPCGSWQRTDRFFSGIRQPPGRCYPLFSKQHPLFL